MQALFHLAHRLSSALPSGAWLHIIDVLNCLDRLLLSPYTTTSSDAAEGATQQDIPGGGTAAVHQYYDRQGSISGASSASTAASSSVAAVASAGGAGIPPPPSLQQQQPSELAVLASAINQVRTICGVDLTGFTPVTARFWHEHHWT